MSWLQLRSRLMVQSSFSSLVCCLLLLRKVCQIIKDSPKDSLSSRIYSHAEELLCVKRWTQQMKSLNQLSASLRIAVRRQTDRQTDNLIFNSFLICFSAQHIFWTFRLFLPSSPLHTKIFWLECTMSIWACMYYETHQCTSDCATLLNRTKEYASNSTIQVAY